MKLEELQDKQGNVNIEVKIIWDMSVPKEMFGRMTKSVLVANIDSVQGDGSPTAYLDLYNENIDLYKKGDNIRVINAYSKLIQNGKNQFRLTNAKAIEKIV